MAFNISPEERIRLELLKLGFDAHKQKLCRFSLEDLPADTPEGYFSFPILSYDEFPFLDLDAKKDIFDATRKKVFVYNGLVVKTGKLSPYACAGGIIHHDSLAEKMFRTLFVQNEFAVNAFHRSIGLPVVEQLALFKCNTNNEYMLCERRGKSISEILDNLALSNGDGQSELEHTLAAAERFRQRLVENKTNYVLQGASEREILNHLIRFDRAGGYEVLVTGGPVFDYGSSQEEIDLTGARLSHGIYNEYLFQKNRQVINGPEI